MYATPDDFSKWQAKAEKMTVEALAWSARDAHKAAIAVEEHDPILAGRYTDEAMTYETELRYRHASERVAWHAKEVRDGLPASK